MNLAEFKKNVWIYTGKLTFIIIGIVYLLSLALISLMAGDGNVLATIFQVSLGFFFIFTTLWGTMVVSSSLISEVRNRTWIYQKMSAINAIDMCFGKMFGPTFYQWSLGLILLVFSLIIVPFQDQIESIDALNLILQIFLGTIFLHAVSLLLSLLIIRRNKDSTDVGNIKSTPMILVFFITSLVSYNLLKINNPMLFSWYGLEINLNLFNLISLVIFTLWALVGYYRTMREELQYENKPNYWLAFNLFIVLFYSGLIYSGFKDPSYSEMYKGFFAISFTILILVTLFALFLEPIDIMQYNSLVDKYKKRDLKGLYLVLPLWLKSLVFSFIVCILVCITLLMNIGISGNSFKFLLPLVFFLFLVKSLLVNLLLHLKQLKKPNLIWFLYLALWYGLLPALLMNFDATISLYAFYPVDPFLSGLIVSGLIVLLLIAIKLVLRKNKYVEG